VALDESSHESTRFGLFDKVPQKSSARLSPVGRADGLLYSGKLSVEDASAWQLLDVREEAWLQAS
jgi:hypothetical protein